MKKLFLFLTLFVTGVVLFGCTTAKASGTTYVAIDINPSVELVVEDDIVVAVNPKNEDGEILLFELDVVGLNVEVAVEAIIDRAIELGYIDIDSEENVVYVSALGDNEKHQEKTENRIQTRINNSFVNRGVYGYVARHLVMDDIISEAQALEVPVGLLRLVKIAQEFNPELTTEEALELSPRELMQMVKEDVANLKEVATQKRLEFQEERQAILDNYQPQMEALRDQIHALLVDIENETDEEALALLQEDLVALREELHALVEMFRTEVQELREEFVNDSTPLQNGIREAKQERIDEFRESVEALREQNRQGVANMIRERIEDLQKEHAEANKGR